MLSNRITILGINPGTRYLGFSVLRGSVLADWGVCGVGNATSQNRSQNVKLLVSRLIAQYEPAVLTLKKLHPARRSATLRKLCFGIQKLATDKDIEIRKYSIQEMENFFSPESRINKRKMAELAAIRHPALCHELRKEQDNLNPYHIRMFEAVALSIVAEAKISGRFALSQSSSGVGSNAEAANNT